MFAFEFCCSDVITNTIKFLKNTRVQGILIELMSSIGEIFHLLVNYNSVLMNNSWKL